MVKNLLVSTILFLGSTSLVLLQTQQPARADFLDDLSSFLKGAGIGADLVNGIDRATNPDGSVYLGKAVKATQRAVGQFREVTSDTPPQPVVELQLPDEVESSPPDEIDQNPVGEDVSSEEAIPDASEYDTSADQAEVEPE